ncbi:MAG: hypothetical protein ABIH82_02120, partial [Candidatus Woesearchaeota archaeon]
MNAHKNICIWLLALLFVLTIAPAVSAGDILMTSVWEDTWTTDRNLEIGQTDRIRVSLFSTDQTHTINYLVEARNSAGTVIASYSENNVGPSDVRYVNVPANLNVPTDRTGNYNIRVRATQTGSPAEIVEMTLRVVNRGSGDDPTPPTNTAPVLILPGEITVNEGQRVFFDVEARDLNLDALT